MSHRFIPHFSLKTGGNGFAFRNLFSAFSLIAFIVSIVLNLNAYVLKKANSPEWFIRSSKREWKSQLHCLTATIGFQKAWKRQRQGMAMINLANGTLNLKATWELIPNHFNGIWDQQLEQLDLVKLRSDEEERKYFVAFSDHLDRPSSCNVITLGIGHSVWAERNLSRIYPECHFLGVDPSADINANLVKEMGGTFVQAAIGGLTVRRGPVNVWEKDVLLTGAQRRLRPQIGIMDFLQKYNAHGPVDLMLIDVEGAEFGIIEQLVDHGDKLPVPVCQLNMEVHHPDELVANSTHQRFFRYFDRLMRHGQFALMHADINNDPRYHFLRLFLVNVADERCVRKFMC